MLSPSDRRTNRIARFVMRTQAVPIPVSANGRIVSATATSTTPTHALPGCFFQSRYSCMEGGVRAFLGAVADPLAQEAGRTEDEHRDQHEECEDVLVVGTEQRQVRIVDAAPRDRIGPRRDLAQ